MNFAFKMVRQILPNFLAENCAKTRAKLEAFVNNWILKKMCNWKMNNSFRSLKSKRDHFQWLATTYYLFVTFLKLYYFPSGIVPAHWNEKRDFLRKHEALRLFVWFGLWSTLFYWIPLGFEWFRIAQNDSERLWIVPNGSNPAKKCLQERFLVKSFH